MSNADLAGDPGAGADAHDGAVDVERLAEVGDQPLGEVDGLLWMGELLAHDDELVAADAGHHVAAPDGVGEPLADGAQQLVARGVAVVVVDRLEAVEVDEQHGHLLLASRRARDSAWSSRWNSWLRLTRPVSGSCVERCRSSASASFSAVTSTICIAEYIGEPNRSSTSENVISVCTTCVLGPHEAGRQPADPRRAGDHAGEQLPDRSEVLGMHEINERLSDELVDGRLQRRRRTSR